MISFKSRFLNHVDILKVKTKKINDSIKNMYENNENTFLRSFFMLYKKNDNKHNSLDHRNVEVNYIYDKKLQYKKNVNQKFGNSFYYNEIMNDVRTDNLESTWKLKNINKLTSKLRSGDKNKRNYILNGKDKDSGKDNTRSRRCTNIKTAEYNLKNYSHNNDSTISYNTSTDGFILKYQNDMNDLLDYNVNLLSNSFLKKFSGYKNKKHGTSSDISTNHIYTLEEDSKFYKFSYDENIRTLYENVDTKTSGDESANSLLKETYDSYQRRNKKYRKLFKYIKDLKKYIKRREDKIRNANSTTFKGGSSGNIGSANVDSTNVASSNVGCTNVASSNVASSNVASSNVASSNVGATNVGSTNVGSTNVGSTNVGSTNVGSTNVGSTNVSSSSNNKGAVPDGKDNYAKNVIKEDEELLKKLIEYKYSILQRQRKNIMKKKNKKNIYMNEYSDEIEMFSDTESEYNSSEAEHDGHRTRHWDDTHGNNQRDSDNNNTYEMKKRRSINEKKKKLEVYLIMNNLYNKYNKGIIPEESHTINKKTDVYWRLAYAKRDINLVDTVSNNDWNEKFDSIFKSKVKTKRNGGTSGGSGSVDDISGSDTEMDESNHIANEKDITNRNNSSNNNNSNSNNNSKNNNGNNNSNNSSNNCNNSSDNCNNSSNNCNNNNTMSENIHLETKLKNYVDTFNVKQYNKYITSFQLAQAKPYVVDPLIYDSKKILDKFIPINGRYTARALCKILAFTNNQFFFPSYIMNKVRKTYSLDNSIESLMLTGGMSRKWGMGFQLFECEYQNEINENFYMFRKKRKTKGKHRNRKKKMNKENANVLKKKRIVGYGQSDFSGCLAISFPEIDLSLTILLSDIFKGADVIYMAKEKKLILRGNIEICV
ncbi:atypical protein kinase, ABC-1 family, putative [Plasmodium malariae]|uniref:Atypical protein kinase, ABC-1 family, putative n=1 Tax=Plasmodium malariae TaxID=5858 RepID=A0A1C3KFI6_PLAMA|nr:atypical protein kinase, ABC-1 family, putative [Plasmodium malariae]